MISVRGGKQVRGYESCVDLFFYLFGTDFLRFYHYFGFLFDVSSMN